MADQAAGNRLDSDLRSEDERAVLSSQPGSGNYEIHVKGHLNSQWSDWLEGMQLKLLENGEMILSGMIVDQAALMGVLNKLYRLNLPLISVNAIIKNDD